MYLGFLGLRAIIQALPMSLGRSLGRAVGDLAYVALVSQRRLALRHLEFAFGSSVSPAERRGIARRMFRHLSMNAVEWFKLTAMSREQVQRWVRADGVEHLRQALAGGNGAIVVSGHFGNWELLPIYLAGLGFHGGVLARRLRYPEYEHFVIDMRGRFGVPTLARGSLKAVAGLLRANQLVGMMPDQDISSLDGIFVDFLGHPAYTPAGPAALSVLTGAPIVPVFIVREGSGFRLVVEPALRSPQAADRKDAIAALTQAWSDVVAAYIRRQPDHWVWMHRRWKTQAVRSAAHGISGAAGIGPAAECRARGRSASPPRTAWPPARSPVLALGVLLATCGLLLAGGCSGRKQKSATSEPTQEMSTFTLTGYQEDGSKRWVLNGQGASVEDGVVRIINPDGVGYEPDRTAFVTAATGRVNQVNRHVRLERDVTIHTSDGLWLTSQMLDWMPDDNHVETDQPVRIETDHMLLRGRGATGQTQLKEATILRDIELILNPSERDERGPEPTQVTITCDGPLSFDYGASIAVFENNVHVKDPNGDLYSDKLIAYLDEQTHTIRYAEATGRVRIHKELNTAMSQKAIYEPAIGKITLLGKPSLLIYPEKGEGGAQVSFGAPE